MRTRILPPEEWQRLDGLDIGKVLKYVSPENIAVIVVESDEGEILGHMSVLTTTYIEGTWIKPGHPTVLRPLLRQAMALAEVRNEGWVFGGAENSDEHMATLIRRIGGQPIPVQFYSIPTGRFH